MKETPARSTVRWIVAAWVTIAAVSMFVVNRGGPGPVQTNNLVGSCRVWLVAMPYVGAYWLWAWGVGRLLQRVLMPRTATPVAMQITLGLAAVSVFDLTLAAIGGLTTPSAWVMTVAGGGLWMVEGWRRWSRRRMTRNGMARDGKSPVGTDVNPWRGDTSNWHWLALLTAPPVAFLLVLCTLPPSAIWNVEAYAYDVLSYHLQLPREWYHDGGWVGYHHNVYSFLPSLGELAYLRLTCLAGGMTTSVVYAAQLLHASLAIASAGVIGAMAGRVMGRPAGWFAAAMFLVTPWTLVVGSMAYNEMFVMALFMGGLVAAMSQGDAFARFKKTDRRAGDSDHVASKAGASDAAAAVTTTGAAGATDVVDTPDAGSNAEHIGWRILKQGVVVGLFAGAATLAKLTAGFMVAAPLGLILLIGWRLPPLTSTRGVADEDATADAGEPTVRSRPRRSWLRHALVPAAVAAAAGVITLSPYLVRNAAATGNPVFPFASSLLGDGHWTKAQHIQWKAGHHHELPFAARLERLRMHWLQNVGYGAVAGRDWREDPQAPTDAAYGARFFHERGFPLIIGLAMLGAACGLATKKRRVMTAAMLLFIAAQLAFWLVGTHMQSRFLLPSIPLLAMLATITLERVSGWLPRGARTAPYMVGVLVIAALVASGLDLIFRQTWAIRDKAGRVYQLPIGVVVGALAPFDERLPSMDEQTDKPLVNDTPINKLPADSQVYLVADNSRLLYMQPAVAYETPFDESLLGRIIRETDRRLAGLTSTEDAAAPLGDATANQAAVAAREVTAALVRRGFTHVWINLNELRRLHGSYGYDPDVTETRLGELVTLGRWRQAWGSGSSPMAIYALPATKAANLPAP